MQMSKIFKFMILSIIFSDSAFCIGIWDYDTELINGYRLIRTNSPSVFIFKKSLSFSEPDYPVVPPKITGLNIYGNIIVGETEFTPVGDDCDASVSGFFILDTETNKLKIGLKKEQWLKILRNMGLEKEPTLIEPSRSIRPSTENIKLSNMPDLSTNDVNGTDNSYKEESRQKASHPQANPPQNKFLQFILYIVFAVCLFAILSYNYFRRHLNKKKE
jgi:hypothetical protein